MRALTEYDAEYILDCILDLKRESPTYSNVPSGPNEQRKVLSNLHAGLSMGAYFGVLHKNGFMLGGISQMWYAPDSKEAFEMLLYVEPEHRGGLAAVRMIKRFEQEAIKRGATAIHAGASTGMAEDRTLSLYQKLGYTVSESVTKEL